MSLKFLFPRLSGDWIRIDRDLVVAALLWTLLVMVLVWWLDAREGEQARQLSEQQQRQAFDRVADMVPAQVDNLVDDIRFLGHVVGEQLLDPSPEEGLQRIRQTLQAFARSRDRYDQVRLLDVGGMERIRLEWQDGSPVFRPAESLQDKSDRYYVKEVLDAPAGAVFLSRLDLNQERGQIEYPLRPTIRAAMMLRDGRGKPLGILVLNWSAAALLARIGSHDGPYWQFMLLDASGFFLQHPDPEWRWGADLGLPERAMPRFMPTLWEEITYQQQGSFEAQQGYWLYRRLSVGGSAGTRASAHHALQEWVLLSRLDLPRLMSTLTHWRMAVWGAGALVWGLGMAGLLALRRSRVNAARTRWLTSLRQLEYDTMLAASPDGFMQLDREGVIRDVNQRLCRLLGYEREALLGQVLSFLCPQGSADSLLARVREQGSVIIEAELMHALGQAQSVELGISYLSGLGSRYYVFVRDISERQQQLSRLHLLSQALDYMPTAVLITDPAGRIEYVNLSFTEMSGYTAEEVIGHTPTLLNSGLQGEKLFRQMWQTIESGKLWQGEFFNRHKNGRLYWAEAHILPVYDARGQLQHYVAVEMDVSSRKDMQHQLLALNDDLEQQVQALERHNVQLRQLMLLVEALQRLHGVSDAGPLLAAQAQEPLLSMPVRGLFICQLPGGWQTQASWGQPVPVPEHWQDEVQVRQWLQRQGAEDQLVWLLEEDQIWGVLAQWPLDLPVAAEAGSHDPSEDAFHALNRLWLDVVQQGLQNVRLRQTLSWRSLHDALSGLYNRRYLDETLPRLLDQARRRQSSLSLVMLDVDHFKQYNDRYGHAAGDVVLRQVGGYLQAQLRQGDVACRYGGEEMAIILVDCSPRDALLRMDQLRQGIAGLAMLADDGHSLPPVTVSLGVAAYPDHAREAEALMRLADDALYAAKHAGRDRVMLASAQVQPDAD